eukprot:6036981-Pyramimonas_sp.AAC.1
MHGPFVFRGDRGRDRSLLQVAPDDVEKRPIPSMHSWQMKKGVAAHARGGWQWADLGKGDAQSYWETAALAAQWFYTE